VEGEEVGPCEHGLASIQGYDVMSSAYSCTGHFFQLKTKFQD
jgi:hypothetical protein